MITWSNGTSKATASVSKSDRMNDQFLSQWERLGEGGPCVSYGLGKNGMA